MKKVLITGINGFIGQAIAKRLKRENYEIIGIDQLNNSQSIFNTYIVDMAREDIGKLLKEIAPDIIVHCAGCADVNYSVSHPDEDLEGNVAIVHKLLFTMKKCNMAHVRFIFLSSAGVYGEPCQLPIMETTELHPISPYALHKKMAEDVCLYFANNFQFDVRILRIFSAYGPGLHKQLFWDMANKIKKNYKLELFGTGLESRDFIYIDDLVEVIYLVCKASVLDEFIYNVANGEEIYIKDVAQIFLHKYTLEHAEPIFNMEKREGNPNNWKADIGRIKKLGYTQSVTIQEGIQRYITWFREQL